MKRWCTIFEAMTSSTLHYSTPKRLIARNQLTMAGVGKACCTLPTVTTSNYTPKGKHETFAGVMTYDSFSTSPIRGLVVAYDAFGFHPSASQGADLLAETLDAVVLMPDFLEGGLPLSSVLQMQRRRTAV